MDIVDIQMMAFALMLRKFPILFSEIRQTRKNKNSALESLKKLYEESFGQNTTCSELMTKIDDMKTRVKEKTNMMREGNEPIILQSWENTIFQLIEAENNHIERMPGAVSQGLSADDGFEENESKKMKRCNPLKEYETEETIQLSNEELKRYVLLQKLRVLKLKEQKLKRFLRK